MFSKRQLLSVRAMRTVLASVTIAAAVLPITAHAVEALLPVRDFFSADAMSKPVLSPSGSHLAVRIGGANGRYQLAVISLLPPRQVKIIAGFADADVANVLWVNDDRLIFTISDLQSSYTDRRGGDLFAVDKTGEQQRLLKRNTSNAGGLMRVLRDGSSDVITRRLNWDASCRVTQGWAIHTVLERQARGTMGSAGYWSPVHAPDGWLFVRLTRPQWGALCVGELEQRRRNRCIIQVRSRHPQTRARAACCSAGF